jgi:uncharacterized protein YndB with AHSA1/START domain
MIMKNTEAAAGQMQRTVSITRIFDLPVDKIWEAWSVPEIFKKWWGPEGYSCPYCSIDFRTGGKYIASMKGPDNKEVYSSGLYREIIPLKKIVYEDNFSDSKGNPVDPSFYNMPGDWGNVIVSVTLETKDARTKMTMNQTGIPAGMYDDCINGWQQCFDKMEINLQ